MADKNDTEDGGRRLRNSDEDWMIGKSNHDDEERYSVEKKLSLRKTGDTDEVS